MLLTLVFSALAADPATTPAPVLVSAPPVPAEPCVLALPDAPPVADAALAPVPTIPGLTTAVTPSAGCLAVDPAAAPPADGKKKRSLKKTDNNRMEAESKDE